MLFGLVPGLGVGVARVDGERRLLAVAAVARDEVASTRDDGLDLRIEVRRAPRRGRVQRAERPHAHMEPLRRDAGDANLWLRRPQFGGSGVVLRHAHVHADTPHRLFDVRDALGLFRPELGQQRVLLFFRQSHLVDVLLGVLHENRHASFAGVRLEAQFRLRPILASCNTLAGQPAVVELFYSPCAPHIASGDPRLSHDSFASRALRRQNS